MKLKLPPANRIAAYLTSLAALLGALAPVVANLDLASTIGVLGGVLALLGVFREWLKGWRQSEIPTTVPLSAVPASAPVYVGGQPAVFAGGLQATVGAAPLAGTPPPVTASGPVTYAPPAG